MFGRATIRLGIGPHSSYCGGLFNIKKLGLYYRRRLNLAGILWDADVVPEGLDGTRIGSAGDGLEFLLEMVCFDKGYFCKYWGTICISVPHSSSGSSSHAPPVYYVVGLYLICFSFSLCLAMTVYKSDGHRCTENVQTNWKIAPVTIPFVRTV